MSRALKRTINIIIDIIVVLILIVSVLVVTLSLTSKSSGVPNIFGFAPLSVMSDSMTIIEEVDTPKKGSQDEVEVKKSGLLIGDLIISRVTNDADTFEVGDIVSFPGKIEGETKLFTHRIVEVINDDNITYYRTKGDNAKAEPDPELQTSSTIVAEYTGNKISGLGNVLSFIRTPLGFFLCVLLPMIIFFVYEAVRVVINIIAYSKEKAVEEAKSAVGGTELTEEQKKQAIEEYLASLGENQSKQSGNESLVQTPADDDNSESDT